MIAVGLGCRAGCGVDQVLQVLEQALSAAGCCLEDVQALYSADFKSGEGALRQAAERLHKPLVLLATEQLLAQAGSALTCSAATLQRFGLPSIAETAALAGMVQLQGSGARAQLLGPRLATASATCALARNAEREP